MQVESMKYPESDRELQGKSPALVIGVENSL
jgi:hypothetical protein